MKNLLLLTALTVVLATQAQVRNYTKKSSTTPNKYQTVKKSKASGNEDDLSFFVIGGVQYSSIGGVEIKDNDGKFGITFGIGAQKSLGTKFEFEANALYGSMGAIFEDDEKLKINYIQIPLLLNYKTNKAYRFGLGLQYSFLSNADYDGEDWSDIINKKDIGLLINFSFPLSEKITYSTRYYAGFSNIVDDGTDITAHNNALLFGICVKI